MRQYWVVTSSADADKRTQRVYRSVKVTKHGTIRYVEYGFLSVCCSNFVPFGRAVFSDIWLQNAVTLKPRYGSLMVIESGTIQQIGYGFLLVFYRNFVRFWEIHLWKYHDLENGLGVTKSHWK